MKNITIKNVNVYLAMHPRNVSIMLQRLQQTIKSAAPYAEEVISYQMPAYKFHGVLVYFAAFKNHIGFYPTSSGVAKFKKELSFYKTSKGTVQFPIDKPLPLSLIRGIVRYRVKENLNRKKLNLRHKKKVD